MDKVLAKNGARHDIEKLFDDLQLDTRNAIIQTLAGLVDAFGIVAERAQDGTVLSSDTSLKVTEAQENVHVAQGSAVTSELHFLDVITMQSVSVIGLSDGIHALYIRTNPTATMYAPVMNGFKYAPGETTTVVRESDGYEFVWDVNPTTASGMVLADVTVSDDVVTLVTDRRQENLYLTRRHNQNTDTYTTSNTFKVGGLSGALVLTEGELPLVPPRFVITDVLPEEAIEHIDSSVVSLLPIDMTKALISTHVTVKLEWGNWYPSTFSTAPSGIVGIYGSYADDVLIGMHLYSSTHNKDYQIIDNSLSGNQMTIILRNLDGSVPPDNENLTDAYILHPGATFYEIIAVPFDINSPDERQRREWSIQRTVTDSIGNLVTLPEATIDIPIGQKYNIYVRSCSQFMRSAYLALQAGTYTKEENPTKYYNYGQGAGTMPYAVPYVAQLMKINNGNATISAVASYAGFNVSINPGSGSTAGWTLATAFEVLWSNATGGVNLTTPNYQRQVTYGNTLEISTPARFTYQVMVRPLVGGQIAGDALTCSVVSGAGGAAPNDSALVTVPINFRTFQGSIATVSDPMYLGAGQEAIYVCQFGDVVTPAYSGLVNTPIGITNGDFSAGDLSGWVNWYGADMTSGTSNTTYCASWGSFTTGHAKLQTYMGTGHELAQGFVVPAGVNAVSFTYSFGFEGSASGSNFKVSLLLTHSYDPPVGSAIVLNYNNYWGTSVNNAVITASLPADAVGKKLYIVFNAAWYGGSNYYHVDDITGTWKGSGNAYRIDAGRELNGDVLLDTNSKEFVIVDVITGQGASVGSKQLFYLRPVSGTSGPPTVGTFRIGVTKRGRQVYISRGIQIDYELTRGYFDSDVLVGRKCRIRWYQEGTIGETLADSLVVTGSDQGFIQATDVKIIEDNGNRNIIVDLYDDGTDPENYSGITGTLVLFARPYL
jgi:hypothetical protein